MKAVELKAILKNIPDDAEIIVGDPRCGKFWKPVINHKPATACLVKDGWAERQLHQVNFFALVGHTLCAVSEGKRNATGPTEQRTLNY